MLHTLLSRSLKLRVALSTLAIFLVGLWSLAWYARQSVEADTLRLLSDQQFHAATFAAEEVEQELRDRVQAMQALARTLAPAIEKKPGQLQALLEGQAGFVSLFNAGSFVVDARAVALASVPVAIERSGVDFSRRAHIANALHGKAVNISSLFTANLPGKLQGRPLVSIAVPVWNEQGAVVGALVCAIDVSRPSFLDNVTDKHRHEEGSYIALVDPQTRRTWASSNSAVANAEVPPAGVNPEMDRFLGGFDGTQVLLNPAGVLVLGSVRHVPTTSWLAVVALPMSAVLAPIKAMQWRTMVAALILSVLGGALTWLVLRWEFRPLSLAVDNLTRRSAAPEPTPSAEPLQVWRNDEIGRLVRGFNQVLQRLSEHQRAQLASETRFRTAFRTMRDAININRLSDGVYLDVNEGFERITGWRRDEVAGKSAVELSIWRHPQDRVRLVHQLHRDGFVDGLEAEFGCKDGSTVTGLMSARVIELDGEPCILSVTHDISERKQVEQQLRLSASVFRHAREGMVITDAQESIVDVNEAFTRITGYTRDEVLGQNPHLLRSRRHDRAFYVELWRALREQGFWSGEIWNRRKNGDEYPERETIVAVTNERQIVTHYIALFADITETKALQEQVRQLAFYDPLTALPNRRLFDDRLQQCMAATQRSGYCAALLLLDLDKFKQLNDQYGHLAGDALLAQIAHALSTHVRAVDTVARFGGDEFLILLHELHQDREQSRVEARRIADKVRGSLAQPFDLYVRREGRSGATHIQHRGSASIGVVLFCGQSVDREQILQNADTAMYRAKRQGGDAVVLHDDAEAMAE